MPLPNHSALVLSVYQMVLNRLPFMEDTPDNTELAGAFTLEMMEELELCFQINAGLTIPPDVSLIGDENLYTMAQRVVLADLVSYYLLFRFAIVNTAGDGTTTPASSFLKSAKAGSVAVEFEQIDVKSSSMMSTTVERMLDLFKNSAIRKARTLGCTIDICDDCLSVACDLNLRPASFIVTPYGSGSSNDGVTEQG